MKSYHDVVYAACAAYVNDHEHVLGASIANHLRGLLRSRSVSILASCQTLFPHALTSRESRRVLMQVEAFFKKNSLFSTDRCRDAALANFHYGERLCRITNKRLDWYYSKRHRLDADLALYLSRMESWISSTLGSFDTFLEQLPRLTRVTAGATARHNRRSSIPFMKLRRGIYASSGAIPYLEALNRLWGGYPVKFKTLDENRVETVPKNWKTDRTIACEPEGSVFLQLAFDAYCKQKLRRRGVNLSDQSLNQRRAVEGSIDGSVATIDLEMASDTLAYNTVAWLLPKPWLDYLTHVRSPLGRISQTETTVRYAKFSSMGNGATFALETLVFLAAVRAVGDRRGIAYGDDIIVATQYVPQLTRLLSFLGFRVNLAKSYANGPFRESCGVNSFSGVDITPFYIRELDDRKAVKSHFVNGLAPLAYPGGVLGPFLRDLVHSWDLPLCPWTSNTCAGVQVSVHHAYKLRLFRMKHGIQYAREYLAHSKTYTVSDSRPLFLWHLASGRERKSIPVRTSSAPHLTHKYVRKWVHWIPPVTGATDQPEYWWSDLVTAR